MSRMFQSKATTTPLSPLDQNVSKPSELELAVLLDISTPSPG